VSGVDMFLFVELKLMMTEISALVNMSNKIYDNKWL